MEQVEVREVLDIEVSIPYNEEQVKSMEKLVAVPIFEERDVENRMSEEEFRKFLDDCAV